MKKEIIVVSLVFTFCSGLGIGWFLAHDSYKAKEQKLEAQVEELVVELEDGDFYMTILDLKVQEMFDIWRARIEVEANVRLFIEEALEDGGV